MQILLAPLFFHRSFCKNCARVLYKQNPDEWIWEHELRGMPPLGNFEPEDGFAPDLSVLMMFGEFAMDAEAHERISGNAPPAWLGAWPDVVQMLEAEGALSVVDVKREVKRTGAIRGAMLRRDMQNPQRWANAMDYFDNILAAAERAFGPVVPAARRPFSWEYDAGRTPNVRGSDGEVHSPFSTLLMATDEDLDDAHSQLQGAALDHLRSHLREVNAGLGVASALDIAPMFWAPYKGYLEEKGVQGALREAQDQADAARLFFSVTFPRFRLESVRELARLRCDKRLSQLREVITAASRSGEIIDPQYPQRILEEVLQVERKIGRTRQICGWISSAIGCVPIPGLPLGATAMSELVSRRLEGKLRRDWNWFYLISDGTGHS